MLIHNLHNLTEFYSDDNIVWYMITHFSLPDDNCQDHDCRDNDDDHSPAGPF